MGVVIAIVYLAIMMIADPHIKLNNHKRYIEEEKERKRLIYIKKEKEGLIYGK